MLAHLDGDRRPAGRHRARARASRAQRAVVRPGALAVPFRGIGLRHRARAAGRDRRLPPLRPSARADELPRPDPERVLLRRPAAPRPHHQGRQPPRPPAADRGRLALPAPATALRPSQGARAPGPERRHARAWQAQISLHHRHRHLTSHGKRSTVANVAVARELSGFMWAAMTHQPLREEGLRRLNPDHTAGAGRPASTPGETSILLCDARLATLVRGSSRPDTVLRSRPAHLRVTSRRCRRAGRPAPAPPP